MDGSCNCTFHPDKKAIQGKAAVARLSTLGLLILLTAGCSTTNITKLTQALAKDPAIVVVKVSSVYGTVNFTRVGAVTNGMTISADGTVQIKPAQ